jgi:hypothetical protein
MKSGKLKKKNNKFIDQRRINPATRKLSHESLICSIDE